MAGAEWLPWAVVGDEVQDKKVCVCGGRGWVGHILWV